MVKVGDKIWSEKYPNTPKGNIFTVVHAEEDGYVEATCDAGCYDGGDDYPWIMYATDYTVTTASSTPTTTPNLAQLSKEHGIIIRVTVGDVVVEYDGRDNA